MTMKFSSLGGFAAHLLTIEADLELTREVCVEKACRMVEKEAKAAIGTYRFDWPPLQPVALDLPDSFAHKLMQREGESESGTMRQWR